MIIRRFGFIIFGDDFSQARTRNCAHTFACMRGWKGGSAIHNIFQSVQI